MDQSPPRQWRHREWQPPRTPPSPRAETVPPPPAINPPGVMIVSRLQGPRSVEGDDSVTLMFNIITHTDPASALGRDWHKRTRKMK
eukprot:4146678-Pyramimonas_sp.AAC.1